MYLYYSMSLPVIKVSLISVSESYETSKHLFFYVGMETAKNNIKQKENRTNENLSCAKNCSNLISNKLC